MMELSSAAWGMAVVLLVAVLIFVPMLSRRARDRISRHNFSFQTAAQIGATFLGVFLATWFTDWQNRNGDRREAIEALDRMIASTEDRFEDLLKNRDDAVMSLEEDPWRRNVIAQLTRPDMVFVWAKSERVLRFVSVEFAVLLSGAERTMTDNLFNSAHSAEMAIDGTLNSLTRIRLTLLVEKYRLTGVFNDAEYRFLFTCVLNPRTAVQTVQELTSPRCMEDPTLFDGRVSRRTQQALMEIWAIVADYQTRVLGALPDKAPLRPPAGSNPAGDATPP